MELFQKIKKAYENISFLAFRGKKTLIKRRLTQVSLYLMDDKLLMNILITVKF